MSALSLITVFPTTKGLVSGIMVQGVCRSLPEAIKLCQETSALNSNQPMAVKSHHPGIQLALTCSLTLGSGNLWGAKCTTTQEITIHRATPHIQIACTAGEGATPKANKPTQKNEPKITKPFNCCKGATRARIHSVASTVSNQ